MAMTMHVEIVSAEAAIYSGTAEEVIAPAEMGEIGILPRHAQLVTRLKPGEVRIKVPGDQDFIHVFVSGGILEIQPHVVTVLADTGIRAEDLDEAKALEAKQRAEEALRNRQTGIDYARAQAELIEAAAQLQLIAKLRKRLK
ncbi:MAG: F0F1 ATP synthase subunit epsilon [Thiotrichales bacterium]